MSAAPVRSNDEARMAAKAEAEAALPPAVTPPAADGELSDAELDGVCGGLGPQVTQRFRKPILVVDPDGQF